MGQGKRSRVIRREDGKYDAYCAHRLPEEKEEVVINHGSTVGKVIVTYVGGGSGGEVAVGVGVARGERVEEAGEVVDVEDRGDRAGIAVGVAGKVW